ncbi:MAG TPA: hypothetical protein DET40_22625 [Lentisphaeria bacterium]|nr:hypothetical protein [Lentisphaeria bacterium]
MFSGWRSRGPVHLRFFFSIHFMHVTRNGTGSTPFNEVRLGLKDSGRMPVPATQTETSFPGRIPWSIIAHIAARAAGSEMQSNALVSNFPLLISRSTRL